MNRLKKIFAALSELATEPSPSKAIAGAWADVRDTLQASDIDDEMRRSIQLVGKVIAAVCGIADDQDKAKEAAVRAEAAEAK